MGRCFLPQKAKTGEYHPRTASFAASRLEQSMDALMRDEIRYETRRSEYSDRSPVINGSTLLKPRRRVLEGERGEMPAVLLSWQPVIIS